MYSVYTNNIIEISQKRIKHQLVWSKNKQSLTASQKCHEQDLHVLMFPSTESLDLLKKLVSPNISPNSTSQGGFLSFLTSRMVHYHLDVYKQQRNMKHALLS